MQNLISFDLHANFGFFRKPETNDGINLSYTMLHKPALLGILGAIIGLEGYKTKGELPQYYQILKELPVGIKPLNDENGNFPKTVIKYSNTVGYANKGATYLTEEATLIRPSYRCFLLLDTENEHHQKLKKYIQNGWAEYLPYFGKNEFSAWWNKESFEEYEFEKIEEFTESIQIDTLFLKTSKKINKPLKPKGGFKKNKIKSNLFVFFERLPFEMDTFLYQYKIGNFVFSNFIDLNNEQLSNLYKIKNQDYYVQLN